MRESPLGSFLILLLRGYRRVLSPLLGQRCRFYPTCSAYCIDAIRVHGVVKGLGLTGLRVLKCQPFHPGGLDPVPPARGWPMSSDLRPGGEDGVE